MPKATRAITSWRLDSLPAAILNAAELKQRMAHVAGLPQAYKESVVTLAVETEPVKFAKMKLEGERCRFWDEWADRLLEDTKPTPEEEQAKKDALKAAVQTVKAERAKKK